MQHPSQKFVQLQFVMLGVAFLFGIMFLIKTSFVFFLLFVFYSLALSLIFEGLAHYSRHEMLPFAQQVIRALLIVVFATILYF
ncbi:hypothetical protein GLW08_14575 [Pontibacillus yanchengensis]|uniref:Uncharacterized protein n=2 Tax=Pontibacillus yanchengensis TaxID=462910 RepID=A0ACC7VID7_9BACI|nr:hypothetical protein [Pontibacillus yanchengensis]MYL35725.1 hypothetical protein [Pontibacillus yanchengensis]MYL54558.1 hypothetical protein [Pontibacillus yanchengensis]